MRVLDPPREQPAGLHHLMARVVDRRRRVIDGTGPATTCPSSSRAWGRSRGSGPPAPWSRSAGTGRGSLGSVRLHVPGVELGWPADQEQQDAIDVTVGAADPAAARACIAGSPSPSIASDPAWRKSRRVRPSQKWTGFLASIRIIVRPRRGEGSPGRKAVACAVYPERHASNGSETDMLDA